MYAIDLTTLPEILRQQLAFVIETDRLKQVLRRTHLMDGSRLENTAEHSWQLALMAFVLAEHAVEPIDLAHTIELLLVHDLVEIDAGDTFAFDSQAYLSKAEREQAAATRIFGLLPDDKAQAMHMLWEEFEAAATAEARFAIALDRLAPMLCNTLNQGGTWREHRITRAAVLRRMDPIRTAMPSFWPLVLQVVDTVERDGYLGQDDE